MSAFPNRDRRAERREATRREIVDAAWEIARRDGLAAVTLREVAGRIGMRSPSLYSHFDSKNAIYDAMFAQAWGELRDLFDARQPLPAAPREALLTLAEGFFDFSVSDLARYQLMNRRTIPGFLPSEEAYAVSVAVYVIKNFISLFLRSLLGDSSLSCRRLAAQRARHWSSSRRGPCRSHRRRACPCPSPDGKPSP